MDYIINHWETILSIVGRLVTICSALLAVLPESWQKALGVVIKILNFLSVINPKTVSVEEKK